MFFWKRRETFFEIKQLCAPFLLRFAGILPGFLINQNFCGRALAHPPATPLHTKFINSLLFTTFLPCSHQDQNELIHMTFYRIWANYLSAYPIALTFLLQKRVFHNWL